MKISFQQIQKVLQVYREKQAKANNLNGDRQSIQRSDRISLSPAARELQQKMKIDRGEPVRRELVQWLKREIETGRYSVPGQKVAEKMVYRNLVDECCED